MKLHSIIRELCEKLLQTCHNYSGVNYSAYTTDTTPKKHCLDAVTQDVCQVFVLKTFL